MTRPTYLDEHCCVHPVHSGTAGRPVPLPRTSPVPVSAVAAAGVTRATALRIDTDGRLSEVPVPTVAAYSAMSAHVSTVPGEHGQIGVGVEVLDTDLAMWFDEDGVANGVHNPAASVVVAMFGRPGPMHGPVVFTGWADPQPGLPAGAVCDVSVAATILLAGVAASCDPAATSVDRAAEFARLDIDIVPATVPVPDPHPSGEPRAMPRPDRDSSGSGSDTGGEVSYDAQAHTVTVDGDVARCVECGEPAAGLGHPEHQPDVLGDVRAGR